MCGCYKVTIMAIWLNQKTLSTGLIISDPHRNLGTSVTLYFPTH